MLLLAEGRSVTGSPVEGFSGYPLDARTTTTDADLEDSGIGCLSELAATALRCANSPPFTSGIIPLASGSPKRALNSNTYGSSVPCLTMTFTYRTPWKGAPSFASAATVGSRIFVLTLSTSDWVTERTGV